jgi:nicotinate-nucleotide pyrophosphorylase (carboxylating)
MLFNTLSSFLFSLSGSTMSFNPAEIDACTSLAERALEEDLGDAGDLTSQALIPEELAGKAVLVARGPGVLAGLPAAEIVFELADPELVFQSEIEDGAAVSAGTRLAVVSGPMRAILTGERTALNFVQRLSGVASQTRRHVDLVADLPCRILDTRKTTPGWRLLEKYAVRCGGGHNHRMGLFDSVLIKDNHLAALGTGPEVAARAVQLAREKYGQTVPVEVEVDNLEQLDRALAAGPDVVLLDNMGTDDLREAVRRRNAAAPGVRLEASGGVTLTTLRGIAQTGVDDISIGALTHSAVALDIALDYLR